MADPSTTTTTDASGAGPLPCDQVAAQAAQDSETTLIVALAAILFLLAMMLGLALWRST